MCLFGFKMADKEVENKSKSMNIWIYLINPSQQKGYNL